MSDTSWVDIPPGSAFPLSNVPFGIVSNGDERLRHVAIAIGDQVVDLKAVASLGLLDDVMDDPVAVFAAPSLNAFLAKGRTAWTSTRRRLQQLLTEQTYTEQLQSALTPQSQTTNYLPFDVADYVDFYSSEHHARNVSAIFRPDSPNLPENWKSLPIGYHGRSGTVVVSGTPILRPHGQRKPRGAAEPTFGPSTRLDIEAEVGFVVGTGSDLGTPVPARDFREHIFGVVLVNDWSARDIQAWEYAPLGPFLGKSFATSVSSWVVPLDALETARVSLPRQDPPVFDYLTDDDPWCLDLELEVELNGTTISRPPFRTQYWSPGQQLAHMTVNGASSRVGDLFASGTVSGPERSQRGSLLELSWGGTEPFTLDDGSTRTFLQDDDVVSITGWAAGADGSRIGFGSVSGRIVAG